MSYARTYHESVSYSGSVSYPASERGGSVSYHGNVPVTVVIHVDTDPFDSSVDDCENYVNVLTGSVVATQAAQIAEINKSATQISQTVVKGFFKTVSSEISQQITALENEANSTLLHLQESMKKVLALKEQMKKDYGRITERYVSTFEELNAELINRIWQIDSKIFEFEKIADKSTKRLCSDLSNTVSVFGRENASLSAKISASSAKDKALTAINRARDFLFVRKQMDHIIQEAAINEAKERTFYAPGCFMEAHDKSFNVFLTKENKFLGDSEIIKDVADKFKGKNLEWQNISEKECEQISVHLNACINEQYNSSEPRIKRIREMTQKLVNLQGVQICRN